MNPIINNTQDIDFGYIFSANEIIDNLTFTRNFQLTVKRKKFDVTVTLSPLKGIEISYESDIYIASGAYARISYKERIKIKGTGEYKTIKGTGFSGIDGMRIPGFKLGKKKGIIIEKKPCPPIKCRKDSPEQFLKSEAVNIEFQKLCNEFLLEVSTKENKKSIKENYLMASSLIDNESKLA